MTATERPQAPVSSRYRFDLGLVVAGLVLLALGSIWLLDVTDVVQLRAAMVLPALLSAVGVALMVGSFQGHHPGLVVTGVLLAVATVFSALTPAEALRGGIGERYHTIRNASELEPRYDLAIGELTLDLGELELTDVQQVDIAMGSGRLVVLLPDDLPVAIDASASTGEVSVLDETSNGLSVQQSHRSPGYAEASGKLDLDIEIGAGSIEVRR